jgi:hypothetical protein
MVDALSTRAASLALISAMAFAACRGEQRPNVEVIGGADTASVSASSIEPLEEVAEPGSATGKAGSSPVKPTTTLAAVSTAVGAPAAASAAAAMRAALTPAQGAPDWSGAQAIYDGSLAAPADPGADAVIRAGLAGTGRSAGLPDDARRGIVERGILILQLRRALRELDAGRVDEARATIAAPGSLLAAAAVREREFGLEGRLAAPIEAGLAAARLSAPASERAAFEHVRAEIGGALNAIFYLGTLRYARLLSDDATPAARQAHLAEAWAYWQALRTTASAGSAAAAQDVEAALSREPTAPWTAADTAMVYARMNDPGVVSALGIPAAVQVRTPPSTP